MPTAISEYGELMNCKHCQNITLESLAAPEGYLHAPSRSSLVRSAQKCRLCSLLFRKDRSRHNSQLRLALEPFSEEDQQICLKIGHLGNDALTRNQLAFFLYTSLGIQCLNFNSNSELSNWNRGSCYKVRNND